MSYPTFGPLLVNTNVGYPVGYLAYTVTGSSPPVREYLTLTTSATGLSGYPPGNNFQYASLTSTTTPGVATPLGFQGQPGGTTVIRDVNSNLPIQYNAVQDPNDPSRVVFEWIGIQIETSSVYKYQNPSDIGFSFQGGPFPTSGQGQLVTGFPYILNYPIGFNRILNPLFGLDISTNVGPTTTLIPPSAFLTSQCSSVVGNALTLLNADQTWFNDTQSGKLDTIQYVTTQNLCQAFKPLGGLRYCSAGETCGSTLAGNVECYGQCTQDPNNASLCVFENKDMKCLSNPAYNWLRVAIWIAAIVVGLTILIVVVLVFKAIRR